MDYGVETDPISHHYRSRRIDEPTDKVFLSDREAMEYQVSMAIEAFNRGETYKINVRDEIELMQLKALLESRGVKAIAMIIGS